MAAILDMPFVSRMKTTNIRGLRHDTTTVLEWVAGGESVDVRRRGVSVAILSPQKRPHRIAKPDFLARIKAAYGIMHGTDQM